MNSNLTNIRPTGHESMKAWDATWKPHKVPPLMQKAILKACNKNREPYDKITNIDQAIFQIRPMFDHWGMRGTGDARTLISQPYGVNLEEVQEFCDNTGLKLISPPNTKAPWHPNAFLLEWALP